MLPVSDAFRQAVTRSQDVVIEAWLDDLWTGDTIALHDVGTIAGGNVAASRERDIQRQASVRVVIGPANVGLLPITSTSPTSPYRPQLRIRRGLVLPDGTTETVPLITARLDRAATRDRGEGVLLELSGRDLACYIRRARRTTTYTIDAGTPLEDALHDALVDRHPDARTNFGVTGDVIGGQVVWLHGPQSDPLGEVRRLAASFGWELVLDAAGVWQLRVPAGIDDTSLFIVADGNGGSLVTLDGNVDTSDDPPNGVQASSSAVDLEETVEATVWDDLDPASPTYRPTYGSVPTYFVSPLIRTVAQAERAATTRLRNLLGRDAAVVADILPDPTIEPGDPWTLSRATSGLDDVRAVVDTVTIPLDPTDLMTLDGRRRFA